MKKYLIWCNWPLVCMIGIMDNRSKHAVVVAGEDPEWEYNPRSVFMSTQVACGSPRIVTLDHEPSPSEVRTLLDGPDPLSECLELLDYFAIHGADDDMRDGNTEAWWKNFDRAQALLEKYREGGK